MIQIIQKIDPTLLDIQPISEYLSQFKQLEILSEDIEEDNAKIKILADNELIELVYLEINGGKWWSIYRYHSDGTKYEQIDSLLFDEIQLDGYNRVIKYSGHIEDNQYSYITCSAFSYLDKEILRGRKKSRTIPLEDLRKVQYSKDMNLTELILWTDDKSNNIIKKEEQKDLKRLELKLS